MSSKSIFGHWNMAIFQDSKVFCNSFIVKIVFKYMCLANPILFFMIYLVFEIVEYFNEGQCNEIKLSAFIYHNLSWRQNKICWCTYKGCIKKMSRFVFFNFSGLEKATLLNDTFLISILKELSKTVFKSFLRQFSHEIW